MHDDDLQLTEEELRRLGYDPRDINVPGIRKAVTGFLMFATFCVVVSIFVYMALVPWHCAGPAPASMVPATKIPPAPNPLLQTDISNKIDIRDMLKQQNAALNSYGWVKKEKGIAHIPIDRAIDLTVQRGLPYQWTPEGKRQAEEAAKRQ